MAFGQFFLSNLALGSDSLILIGVLFGLALATGAGLSGKKSKRKALLHLAMDTYPFGGHHANEVGKVVRAALGMGGGGKATMPSDEPGTVAGEDLRLILAWAEAFDRAHPAPARLDAIPPVEQGHKR